ncbi:hypothetical protein [Mycolicibacterium holsaticum]|uniref:hypothetical protein n=1 Tax=Mycolicibacterium holsaticum TaxID=152142 RepID=UPI000A9259C0|nr:hypothetical protein [Mycolicibacterium holsaticum]MDA4108874.1 hypothetical protein [Mycolicibacterium holsaticum DSM 44478 = JCM 12374]
MWRAIPSNDNCRSPHEGGSVTIVSGEGALDAAPADQDREGRQIFVDALTQLATDSRNPRLRSIIRRLTAPLRVAVRGRRGAGCTTVRAALTAAGVPVTPDVAVADVDVVVIAEVLKPEDATLIGASERPTVVVLNKADLAGFGAGGPLAPAHRRAARYRALTGAPTVPMVGLLGAVVLDDAMLTALTALVGQPADLTSTDAFVQCAHPVPVPVRRRLLDALDRFGIAHAVLALGDGTEPAALPALLRRHSLLDRVVAHVDAAGAPLRYQRIRSAITELRGLAAQSGDDRLTRFLAGDDAVVGVMAAAVDVVQAAGVHVDAGDDPAAHLRRAVQWRRYGNGPVGALHRECAADITRGSLRLLGRSR